MLESKAISWLPLCWARTSHAQTHSNLLDFLLIGLGQAVPLLVGLGQTMSKPKTCFARDHEPLSGISPTISKPINQR